MNSIICLGAKFEEVYNRYLVKDTTGQPVFFVAECKFVFSIIESSSFDILVYPVDKRLYLRIKSMEC